MSPLETILIVDFGSQYTQLIARKVRELGVYCEIHPPTAVDRWEHPGELRGVILSGGPASVAEPDAPFLARTALPAGMHCNRHGGWSTCCISVTCSTAGRPHCRGVSSNASRSHAHWPSNRVSCFSMSP